jgi:hypothetical protein
MIDIEACNCLFVQQKQQQASKQQRARHEMNEKVTNRDGLIAHRMIN